MSGYISHAQDAEQPTHTYVLKTNKAILYSDVMKNLVSDSK